MKSLAASTPDIPDPYKDQSTQDTQPPQEEEEYDQQVGTVSFFLEEEEEELGIVFNLQHTHNTISKGPPLQESTHVTQAPSKGKTQTQKDTLIPESEYNLAEDL